MEYHQNSSSYGTNEMKQTQAPLICGLPDDIAISCLARIPRIYHAALRCVSKRWRDLMASEELYSYRMKHNLDETWIYALCRDKNDQNCCYSLDPNCSRMSWKLVQGIPSRILKRKGVGFEILGKKVYLMGGCGWCEDASDEVFCFDVSTDSWFESASLPIARSYFACEVLNGKIHTIGGLGSKQSDTNSWDTYDHHTNCWKSQSEPNLVHEIEDSVVFEGKIYIRCSVPCISSRVFAMVYEPSSGTWEHADADLASGWHGPAVVIDGRLYVLDQSSGTRLMMWRKESNAWVMVKRLSQSLTRPPCRLVAIGKRIFVIGKGLSTVTFEVDGGTNIGGVMVGSSISKLSSSDCDLVSCKLLML
ncbi:hypothetical protein SAY86_004752 [Trapa natans]|uniref:F-box domain-containing protein n=1 Tax=Trapa natans TaxID=22666 RepID=A0AAN7RJ75_TRANT|nr:hypothetical protein SAY86_004752 [Trapa natans]